PELPALIVALVELRHPRFLVDVEDALAEGVLAECGRHALDEHRVPKLVIDAAEEGPDAGRAVGLRAPRLALRVTARVERGEQLLGAEILERPERELR